MEWHRVPLHCLGHKPLPADFDRSITQGPLHVAVWRIAWPTMLTNLVAGLQGLVDHAVIGHFVGYHGNAAIGISWRILSLVVVFASALYMGMGVLVARFAGRGEADKVDRVVKQALVATAFLGIAVFAPLGWVLSPHLLALVNATPEVQADALGYLRTMLAFNVGLLLFHLLLGALRAAGDARTPLRLSVLMTVVNVVLTLVLVRGLGFIPALGTRGAGIATVAASGITTLTGLYLLFTRRLVIGPAPGLAPDWRILGRVLRIGIPAGLQVVALNITAVLLVRYVGALEHSAEAQAAYAVAYFEIFSLVIWTAIAVMTAAATVAGQNLGAERPDRAAKTPGTAVAVGLAVTLPLGLSFVLIPRGWLALFGMSDPQVQSLGIELLAFLSLTSVFMTISLGYTGALQGTGDTRTPLVITLISQVALPLGLCAGLDHFSRLTGTGIWLAITSGHFVRCMLSVYCFRRGRWRRLKIGIGEDPEPSREIA